MSDKYAFWFKDSATGCFRCSCCESYACKTENNEPANSFVDENGKTVFVAKDYKPDVCPHCNALMIDKEKENNFVAVFKDENGVIVNYLYSCNKYFGEPLSTIEMVNKFDKEKPEPIKDTYLITEEELLKLLLSKYKLKTSQDIIDALPLKPGMNVYQRYHRFPSEIESFHISEDGTCYYEWVEYDRSGDETEVWDTGTFAIEEIGETVFLTPDGLN